MSTGKTVLALALSALLPASAAWAANKDTIIYCSEASPESFNPQIASSGPSFVASSQTLYNRLINFDPVKTRRCLPRRVVDHFARRQNIHVYPA